MNGATADFRRFYLPEDHRDRSVEEISYNIQFAKKTTIPVGVVYGIAPLVVHRFHFLPSLSSAAGLH